MNTAKRKKRIPLFDLSLSDWTRQTVAATLASGWLTGGPQAAALEKAVARLLRVKHAVAVNSATAGLYLTLRAIGARKGTEVITSPFTFVATIEAIMMTGAMPILADIDPHTLNIDPQEATKKVTRKTIAVVPIDIGGNPARYQELNKISKKQTPFVVADAAHSIGARYRNRSIPSVVDAAVISFYSTKNLTCGEGGIVLSRRKRLIDKVRQLSWHGITSTPYERNRKTEWEYDVTDFGFKANMSDVHAAIGLGQLAEFKKDQTKRAALAKRYLTNLATLSDFIELPAIERQCDHGWHLFIIKLNLHRLKISRGRFIRLMANYGIVCGVHYSPVFEFSYYRDALGVSARQFPHAAAAGQRVVTLPLYPLLGPSDVDYACECIGDIVNRYGK